MKPIATFFTLLLACCAPACSQATTPPAAASAYPSDYSELLKTYVTPEGVRYAAWHANKADVERMKKVEKLQFPTYRLIGAVSEDVLKEYESWVLPSEVFFIKLDSLGRDEEGALNATLNIWQQKNVLLKASMKLRKGRPMFVRGPKWGEGYIVIALLLE